MFLKVWKNLGFEFQASLQGRDGGSDWRRQGERCVDQLNVAYFILRSTVCFGDKWTQLLLLPLTLVCSVDLGMFLSLSLFLDEMAILSTSYTVATIK